MNDTETLAVARIVGGPSRLHSVPLKYPVEYQGKTYDAIYVRRMTIGDVMEHEKRVKTGEARAERSPVYADADGVLVSDAVIDGLDLDDWDMLNKEADRFLNLPAPAPVSTQEAPATGDNSSAA